MLNIIKNKNAKATERQFMSFCNNNKNNRNTLKKFLIIYLVSGLGGNLLSLYYDQSLPLGERAVSAGASGAIFGLMGALLYVVIANRGRLGRLSGRGMLFMIALSLYYGLTSTGVDNWAHIGGLVCGFILSVILYRPGRTYGSYGKSYGENGSRFV